MQLGNLWTQWKYLLQDANNKGVTRLRLFIGKSQPKWWYFGSHRDQQQFLISEILVGISFIFFSLLDLLSLLNHFKILGWVWPTHRLLGPRLSKSHFARLLQLPLLAICNSRATHNMSLFVWFFCRSDYSFEKHEGPRLLCFVASSSCFASLLALTTPMFGIFAWDRGLWLVYLQASSWTNNLLWQIWVWKRKVYNDGHIISKLLINCEIRGILYLLFTNSFIYIKK